MIVRHKLAARLSGRRVTAKCVLMEMLDAVIDRAADILERIGLEVDQVSRAHFRARESAAGRSKTYQKS